MKNVSQSEFHLILYFLIFKFFAQQGMKFVQDNLSF